MWNLVKSENKKHFIFCMEDKEEKVFQIPGPGDLLQDEPKEIIKEKKQDVQIPPVQPQQNGLSLSVLESMAQPDYIF